MYKNNIDKDYFIKICKESVSMSQAAAKLNLHFNTFKKYAIKYNCFNANQGGKGLNKPSKNKFPLNEILEGKHPQYQTFKLKIRLIDAKIIEDKCSICGWTGKLPGEKYSTCELHHKDGDCHNHKLENLVMLCPNCHSITPTYRSRNKKHLG